MRSGLSADGVAWAFTTRKHGFYFPLTWLSHMLDFQIHGRDPGAHHFTSVLIHALNGVLLFVALHLLTGAVFRSGLAAALFAWHPLRVESVAWLAERKDVLAGMFWILTLLAYARYARGPTRSRFAVVTLVFVLGLLSKPTVVTLPFALLLLDVWPLGRLSGAPFGRAARDLVVEKLPLFVIAAGWSVLTFVLQSDSGAVKSLSQFSPAARIANAVVAYGLYLRDTVWPTHLAAMYPYPQSIDWPAVVISLIVVCALSGWAYRCAPRAAYVPVGWCWYLGTLVPMIGLAQSGVQARADRFTYIPSIGLSILLVWAGAAAYPRLGSAGRKVAWVAIVAVSLLCLGVTTRQVRFWQDSATIFERTLAVTRDNYVIHDAFGAALAQGGDAEGAMRHYREALRIRPDYPNANNNIGVALAKLGRVEEAMGHYLTALKNNELYADAQANLGILLAGAGRIDEAVAHLRVATQVARDSPDVHYNFGIALSLAGNAREALDQFRIALSLRPGWDELARTTAWKLATAGEPSLRDGAEAVRIAEELCRKHRFSVPIEMDTLAAAYAEAGRFTEAVKAADTARQLAAAQGHAELAGQIEERLAGYHAGRAYREAY